MTLTTKTGNEHFVVLIDEAQSTVAWDVRSNSLVVLFKLHSDALTNGGVGLLGFDSDLFYDNTSGLRRASEGLLPARDRVSLRVFLLGPSSDVNEASKWLEYGIKVERKHIMRKERIAVYSPIETSLHAELASGLSSTGLSTSHFQI